MRTCREPSQADDAMAVTSCVIEISNESMPLHVTKKKHYSTFHYRPKHLKEEVFTLLKKKTMNTTALFANRGVRYY